jgi:hypothetical protein
MVNKYAKLSDDELCHFLIKSQYLEISIIRVDPNDEDRSDLWNVVF